MNIQNLLKNWKTTSAGLTSISLAIVHLVYSIKNGTATETAWEAAIAGVLVGIGLLYAGDASQSAAQVANIQAQINAVPPAIGSGNTEQLKKTIAQAPASVSTQLTKTN